MTNTTENLICYAMKLFRKIFRWVSKWDIIRCAWNKGQIVHIVSPLDSGPKPIWYTNINCPYMLDIPLWSGEEHQKNPKPYSFQATLALLSTLWKDKEYDNFCTEEEEKVFKANLTTWKAKEYKCVGRVGMLLQSWIAMK